MDEPRQFRRRILYLLIGSILFGAVLGLVIVLRGEWSWFEVRVMITAATIAAASIGALACDMARTPRGRNLLPKAGLGLSIAAAALVLGGVWPEVRSDVYWKATACLGVAAVAVVHMCVLSIARLARRFAWVYIVACQVICGLAAIICAMIIGEIDAEPMFQLVAALSIADAAFTLAIPVLHRLSKLDDQGATLPTPLELRNAAAIDAEIAQLQQRIQQLQQLRAEIAG